MAYYGGGEDERLSVPVLSSMAANLRWQSVFVYTVPPAAKQQALTSRWSAPLTHMPRSNKT
ncbi:hypothetical protein [Streptomyces sp. NPDC006691]|uniref:hypothetical protein n=1 Tax=Streptomyces sp. NPDC006691 TaxID=3364757 RepID=UPI0036CB70DE